MKKMNKIQNFKDILTTIVIGIVTGTIWVWVFIFLGVSKNFTGVNLIWLLVLVTPLIFLFGLYLGRFLARWKELFIPFSRYAMIGFLNTGIDFGIFNFLMFATQIIEGPGILLFKTVSFMFATTNSYFWNRSWVFGVSSRKINRAEFVKFIAVSIIGIILNVGIASIGFWIGPQLGLERIVWNNLSAAIATISNLIWNFIGYKLIVFNTGAIELLPFKRFAKRTRNSPITANE